MINIDKQLSNSLNKNIDINVHASTLYAICKSSIKGFPSISYKFDASFSNVINFNDEFDELTIELYMSNLINSIINYYNTGTLNISFKNIPEVIIHQLTLLYGLTGFKELFTKISRNTSFVFNSLWKDEMTDSIRLNELKNIYGKVEKCYNVNTVSVFESFYRGDLNVSSNEEIDIDSYEDTEHNQMKEGKETVYFRDTLKIPSSFIRKYAAFTSELVFTNNITNAQVYETGNMKSQTLMTADDIPITTLSMNTYNTLATQKYKMALEYNIKSIIDKFINNYSIRVISYGLYPYNQYIYQKPGDSKIIQEGKQTVLTDVDDFFIQDGIGINTNANVDCNFFGSNSTREGHKGKLLNYVSIDGWKLENENHSISSIDISTLKNSDIEITYEYKKDNVRYRVGNMFNEQRVYETDREVQVGSWMPSDNALKESLTGFELLFTSPFLRQNNTFDIAETDKKPLSDDINKYIIYLQNKYSYGSNVSLESNPRTACRFTFSNDVYIYTDECKEIIQKLGKVCLYYFINDCLEIIQKNNKEMQVAINTMKYANQMLNKNLQGTFEESAFLGYILFTQNKSIRLTEEQFIKYTESHPLEVSHTLDAKNILLQIHLPKLVVDGNDIRFSTTNHSDYNRYYIYGDSSYWKLRSIPITVSNSTQVIDNTFLIHNEIFSEEYPSVFNNFNVYA